MKKSKVKKPIYKRWWVWLITGVLLLGMLGGGDTEDDDAFALNDTNQRVEEPLDSERDETPSLPNDVESETITSPDAETPVEVVTDVDEDLDLDEEPAQPNPIVVDSIEGPLKVHFLDVGQADAIFIELPNGKSMLVDAGNSSDGARIVSLIKRAGYGTIDFVVVTHPHADHIGGMEYIVNNIDIDRFYMPKVSHNTKTFENMLLAIQRKGLSINTARAGVSIVSEGKLKVDIIAPVRESYSNLNDWSSVVKITYGDTSFLFMGDAEHTSESQITANLSADVLKVGHHGSNTSTSQSFLSKVSPKHAVISVGASNRYGHPTTETLARLTEAGVQIYRTDTNGTITFTSNGNGIVVDKSPFVFIPATVQPSENTSGGTAEPKPPVVENPPSENVERVVFITNTGSKYHLGTCRHVNKSKIEITLSEAKSQGYDPCGVCKP